MRSFGHGFAFDPTEFVFGFRIEALELEQGKTAALPGCIGEGEDDRLILVARNRLGCRHLTAVARTDQPIEVATYDGALHGMVSGNQPLGGGKVFGAPMIQIGANAQRALHRTQHPISERRGTEVEPVWRVGHPGHHDLGCVGVAEAILHGEPVEGVGIVRGPDFVGVAQDAQVDASAAARTAFDFNFGMLLAQISQDRIKIADERDVDATLLINREPGPSPAPTSCGCSPI